MPSLQVFNNDVEQASLAPPASVPERYAELWWYSGATVTSTNAVPGTYMCLGKGGTSFYASNSGNSNIKLYTLNANWNPNTKFAFEASVYMSGSTNARVALYDITSQAEVMASEITATNTTMQVIRSGQFTLTPGHVYGVAVWSGVSTAYTSDMSLIIFS